MTSFATMDNMWRGALSSLLSQGAHHGSRGGGTVETLGFAARLVDPRHAWLWNPVRKLSAAYAGAELLWYLSGSDDASLVKSYAASYATFLDDGIHAYGAYGARWKDGQQLRNAIRLLREQPNTRQCVITCWRPGDLQTAVAKGSKDMPCTLTLQLLLRDQRLHLIATMRSNDAWLGMPYDVWCFTRLQIMIAACIDADVGEYWHRVGSLHLYARDVDKAQQALLAPDSFTPPPRTSATGFNCVDEMEKEVARALGVELAIRAGEGTPAHKIELIQNLLRPDTVVSESVACCAQKMLGIAPAWLDNRLKS